MDTYVPYSCQSCLCIRCIHFLTDPLGCCDFPEVKCTDMPDYDPGYICPDYKEAINVD